MTRDEFNNQRFGANMKASYNGKGKYDIGGVDWETHKILLRNQGSESWVNYRHVEILDESQPDLGFNQPQNSRAYDR